MKVVLIPGWHENVDDMRVFVDGRNGHKGLAALGFDCVVVPEGRGGLAHRIGRFEQFLDDLKAREPEAFPVATFGYSAGGLINRGFLRAFPERAHEIAATFQLGAPNAGIRLEHGGLMLRGLRIPFAAIGDMDVRSSFMRWLNNSDGRLERVAGVRRREWRFSREPFVAPEGCRLLNVAGLWSHKHPGDGVVPLYSATLGGRVPHEIIEASDATHLNLSGAWNLFTLFFRGWRSDDALWPQVVAQAARFFREASDEIAP